MVQEEDLGKMAREGAVGLPHTQLLLLSNTPGTGIASPVTFKQPSKAVAMVALLENITAPSVTFVTGDVTDRWQCLDTASPHLSLHLQAPDLQPLLQILHHLLRRFPPVLLDCLSCPCLGQQQPPRG